MFTTKQSKLFDTKKTSVNKSTVNLDNAFITKGTELGLQTKSQEGALKYSSTSNSFLDQFASASNYRELRSYAKISEDMRLLYSQDKEQTVRLLIYLRLITRTVKFPDGSKTTVVQRGQGLKHESIYRMIWLAVNDEKVFFKNLPLFISAGSWKDIITMMIYDLEWNGWSKKVLNFDILAQFIIAGLENEETNDLVKKYLPQIKSNSKCTTVASQAKNLIAKFICSKLFGTKMDETGWTYKKYRELKVSGKAHDWQQLISKGNLIDIDFKTIHGRALSLLVGGKFLKNNNLEKAYSEWIEAQPVAKYTGYVYELLAPIKTGYTNNSLKPYVESTINKQFAMLIETAKKDMDDVNGFLCVVDSSSSMTGLAPGTNVSAYSIAKSMALYFSYLLKGPFANHFMEFNDNAKLMKWVGSTPVAKIQNNACHSYGGTNFQRVTHELIRIKNSGVPESDFPLGILALSDGEFSGRNSTKTESVKLRDALYDNGFSKEYVGNLKIVFWDIPNGYYGNNKQSTFEALKDSKNTFMMSGFDGAGVAFLTGKTKADTIPQTPEEMLEVALTQEIMDYVSL